MKIKKGDLVQVITGKDKGKQGKVIAAYPREDRVLVEGVNRVKKHTKAGQTARGSQTGGIVTTEAPDPRQQRSAGRGEGRQQGRHPRRLPLRRRGQQDPRCQADG